MRSNVKINTVECLCFVGLFFLVFQSIFSESPDSRLSRLKSDTRAGRRSAVQKTSDVFSFLTLRFFCFSAELFISPRFSPQGRGDPEPQGARSHGGAPPPFPQTFKKPVSARVCTSLPHISPAACKSVRLALRPRRANLPESPTN